MKNELYKIEEEIRIQQKFKISTEAILSSLKAINKDDISDVYNSESLLYYQNTGNLFDLYLNFDEQDFFTNTIGNNLNIKNSIIKDEKTLSELWKNKVKSEYSCLFNQSEKIISEQIENKYFFNKLKERIENTFKIEDSILNFDLDNFPFYADLDFENTSNFFQHLIQKCETIIVKRLDKIESNLVYLEKIVKLLFVVDRRTHFRQIIKFLFKNLDDSHSSVNNSIVLVKPDYLLKKNLYEKRIYRWSN